MPMNESAPVGEATHASTKISANGAGGWLPFGEVTTGLTDIHWRSAAARGSSSAPGQMVPLIRLPLLALTSSALLM